MLDEQIERCFGTGPEHRPVEHRIAAGRRALRRHRATQALTAVGMVAVLGTTYALTLPGRDHDATGQLAVSPTPGPPSTTATAGSQPWKRNLLARYADDGELEIRPGVVVHERIENPYGLAPPDRSDALDVTWRGRRVWTMVELQDDDLAYGTSVPSNGWASFADYVADQVDANGGAGDGWPTNLTLTDGGRVVAAPGVEILQRTDDPRLGDSFSPAGTPTGAVLARVGEVSYFEVWRVVDGELDEIFVAPRVVEGATFEELLAYARARYASGEGLR